LGWKSSNRATAGCPRRGRAIQAVLIGEQTADRPRAVTAGRVLASWRRGGADWRPWVFVVTMLVLGGAGYRVAMAWIGPQMEKPIRLPVALAQFPARLAGWTGEDRPLTPEVQRVAGADDYINRLYVNRITGDWANLYVCFAGRPRSMVGHRPRVCYAAHGWAHDGTQADELLLPGGEKLPFLIHRFHRITPEIGDTVVLNYYVLNGVPTSEESDFAGVGYRLPNIAGNPAFYVAQVQISSVSESSVRRLAAATASRILDFLPDEQGKVRAAALREDAARATANVSVSPGGDR